MRKAYHKKERIILLRAISISYKFGRYNQPHDSSKEKELA
jgi:hypothetical protein